MVGDVISYDVNMIALTCALVYALRAWLDIEFNVECVAVNTNIFITAVYDYITIIMTLCGVAEAAPFRFERPRSLL